MVEYHNTLAKEIRKYGGEIVNQQLNPFKISILLGGCIRAIFLLLKTSSLLPFFFKKYATQRYPQKICVQRSQRIFVDIKLVSTNKASFALRYPWLHVQSKCQLHRHTLIIRRCVPICLDRAYLHQSERNKHYRAIIGTELALFSRGYSKSIIRTFLMDQSDH